MGITRAGARGALVIAMLVAAVAVVAPPSLAHTPHDDVFDVAVSPQFSADSTMLAISRGLMLRSRDAGATWNRLVNGVDNRAQPYAIRYAGGSGGHPYILSGDGVFRSSDGGDGWRRILTSGSNDLRVLATTTGSTEVVVAAGPTTGLRISENGGTTWRSLGTFGAATTAVAFKKASVKVIFTGDASGVLHVTGNAGSTWQHNPLSAVGSITAIAPSPAFTSDGTVLVGTSAGGVVRWNHLTRTATPVNTGLTDQRVTSIAYSANFGWDHTVFASTWTGGVFVSNDRGNTWAASNVGLEWNPQAGEPAYVDRPNFGGVVSALTDAQTRETVVVLASFVGVNTSVDLGAAWENAEALSPAVITGIGLSPQFATDGRAAVTTYVNGAAVSGDRGSTWTSSNLGLAKASYWNAGSDRFQRVFNVAIAPTVAGRQWSFTVSDMGVHRSQDAGGSWQLTPVPGFANPRLTTATSVPRIFVSPTFATDHVVLMVDAVAGDVYRSADEGASFQRVGRVPNSVHCLVAAPTFTVDRRLFACTGAGVYVSTDLGSTWTATKRFSLYDLAVTPAGGAVPETWYGATASGLYRSTDLGASWTRVSLPAPALSTTAIGAVAASPPAAGLPTILVSAKGKGMFRSTNGGASFAQVGGSLLATNEQFDTYQYRNAGSPIVFSPAYATDRTIFGYSHDHLFRSTDGGTTWQQVEVPYATHTGPMPVAPSAPSIGSVTGGNGSVSIAPIAGSDGGAPITRYDGVCTSSTGGTTGSGWATGSPVVVTGLTNGATYTCRLTATNGIGTSPLSVPSAAVVPRTVPSAPTAASAVPGTGQATVSWTAPASDGGSPITGYVVTPYVGYYALPPTTFGSTLTVQTITGLTNGTSYRFKIAAINAVGTGPGSTVSNQVTPS